MRRNLILSAAVLVAAMSPLAAPGSSAIAQPGDPARWYEPADTPEQKYAVAMKEAGAALKEALAECRGMVDKAARRACVAEARANWNSDVALARRIRSAPPEPMG